MVVNRNLMSFVLTLKHKEAHECTSSAQVQRYYEPPTAQEATSKTKLQAVTKEIRFSWTANTECDTPTIGSGSSIFNRGLQTQGVSK